MVSCEFWYACWAVEKLLGSLEVDRKDSESGSLWQTQHISPSILSLLEFATAEHVPPSCRHVAHRLLVRLVRCAVHLDSCRGKSKGIFISIDQQNLAKEYVSTLAIQLNALVEYDLKASMKVTDGMRTMGALDAMDSHVDQAEIEGKSVDARMDESQRIQFKSDAAIFTADQNHPLSRLPQASTALHT